MILLFRSRASSLAHTCNYRPSAGWFWHAALPLTSDRKMNPDFCCSNSASIRGKPPGLPKRRPCAHQRFGRRGSGWSRNPCRPWRQRSLLYSSWSTPQPVHRLSRRRNARMIAVFFITVLSFLLLFSFQTVLCSFIFHFL